MDNYNRVLEVAGDITANTIFPNSEDVDAEGPHCEDGRVRYASKTYEKSMKVYVNLAEAEVVKHYNFIKNLDVEAMGNYKKA